MKDQNKRGPAPITKKLAAVMLLNGGAVVGDADKSTDPVSYDFSGPFKLCFHDPSTQSNKTILVPAKHILYAEFADPCPAKPSLELV